MTSTATPDFFNALLQQVNDGLQVLPDKPEESAGSTLRALWLLAAGQKVSAAQANEVEVNDLPALDAAAGQVLQGLVQQRLAGIPLAHLTERQRFMGLEMLAGPGALIPRVETELLARTAVQLAQRLVADRTDPLHVVDVCTGSGNVALALAVHEPRTQVHASDLSPEAVELAERNAQMLAQAHPGLLQRVQFSVGDLLCPFETEAHLGRVDLLTCNPPYISSSRMTTMPQEIVGHEPSLAFDGGPLGVRILQRLIRQAPQFLRPGGWLAFEVGLGQGPAVARRLKDTRRYDQIDMVTDEAGDVRVLLARAAPLPTSESTPETTTD